ncbi:DNA gyrase inhibitor YacG [Chromatium okenii]|uniref:DNA gyrase inhibitor YacG n=1 Tax=Chromatium okenii TaxID=61644 RepID=A0A2S7XPL0_9GAMM|nr:DNA gyrase inhibitor YacG [Chromatium okenii]PQJ95362.1 DNA gyrase inhibitor YacG [Chromatium okenii]
MINTIVNCPHCGKPVEWVATSIWRPFCSQRCRWIDFGDWIDERHRIVDQTAPSADSLPIASDDAVH